LLPESLKRAVIELLKVEFSALDFTTNPDANCFVTIQPAWNDFGSVEILEDQGQLIVNWGRFTHSHIDSYDEDQEEHINEIVDGLRHQIRNVIADKVAFWGQERGGSGGFFFLNHVTSLDGRLPAYLWSGKELIEPT
jgi:hypothetical protein